jgi:hypothetical protein
MAKHAGVSATPPSEGPGPRLCFPFIWAHNWGPISGSWISGIFGPTPPHPIPFRCRSFASSSKVDIDYAAAVRRGLTWTILRADIRQDPEAIALIQAAENNDSRMDEHEVQFVSRFARYLSRRHAEAQGPCPPHKKAYT